MKGAGVIGIGCKRPLTTHLCIKTPTGAHMAKADFAQCSCRIFLGRDYA
jgi:hypothetical protein